VKDLLLFAAGFGAGWVTRGTFQSSKSAAVEGVALCLDVLARIKRLLAIEREQFEDILAEAHDAVTRRRAARAEKDSEAPPVENAA
jgi:hypothetical protein